MKLKIPAEILPKILSKQNWLIHVCLKLKNRQKCLEIILGKIKYELSENRTQESS